MSMRRRLNATACAATGGLRRLRWGRSVGKKAIALVALALLSAAATASALVLEAGDLVVNANGGFAPTKLPKTEDAPIKIYGGGKLSTVSGELPPILDTLTFEFDRHGSVDVVQQAG